MALKITHIDENRVEGLLDGVLPFHVARTSGTLAARIAGWKETQTEKSCASVAGMRGSAYAMLARYRENQRARTS